MNHGSFSLSLTVLTLAAFLFSLFPLSSESRTLTTASFPAGTHVHTWDGLKSIEDIPAGSELLIPGGGWAAVSETVIREATGLVLLEGNGFSLHATPEHPFLITRGVTAKERFIIEGLPDAPDLGGLRWVATAELRAGEVLKARVDEIVLNTKEKNGKTIVYNLSVPDSQTYMVGEVGLVVGDVSGQGGLSAPDFNEDSWSGGGCFPTGTSVLTDDGLFPIEKIETGDMVRSYDFPVESWTFALVNNLISRDYSGNIITIKAGGSDLTATGNHPFLVMSGESLDRRPPAADVPLKEQNSPGRGRWVEARHIMTGDQLLTPRGEMTVTSLASGQGSLTVYNLIVAGVTKAVLDPRLLP